MTTPSKFRFDLTPIKIENYEINLAKCILAGINSGFSKDTLQKTYGSDLYNRVQLALKWDYAVDKHLKPKA